VVRKLHLEGLDLADDRGTPRGFVDPKVSQDRPVLEDLWIMQGSVCDLRCRHCYTASSPSNNRLQQIHFAELKPHLEDAARYGEAGGTQPFSRLTTRLRCNQSE
jgi:hypothetical protein